MSKCVTINNIDVGYKKLTTTILMYSNLSTLEARVEAKVNMRHGEAIDD